MGYQMLLVLLAVILFSTVFLGTFNSIFLHNEIVIEGAYRLQAQKVADYFFQRVDADLLHAQTDGVGVTNFSSVFSTYSSYGTIVTIDSIDYHVSSLVLPCNHLGDTSSPTANYRLLNARVWFVINSTDTLFVGSAANPMSKVYANNGLYPS